jgi:hypothetical protein
MTRHFLILAAVLFAAQFSSRADLVKSSVLESNVAYLRVGDVGNNLPQEIQAAQKSFTTTNKIIGSVLDLRFAGGADFEAARAAADVFAQNKQPLAILVNGETRGEAVALAAILRQAHRGLVLGNATQAIKFTGGPLQPDIVANNAIADEKTFLENPYAVAAPGDTNSAPSTNNLLPFVDHTSEADLVRAKIKDGNENSTIVPERPAEPQMPVIRDPVLARAVDLIKGLAIVRSVKNQNG